MFSTLLHYNSASDHATWGLTLAHHGLHLWRKMLGTGSLQFYDSVTREPKRDALLLCFRHWLIMGIERTV